LFLKIRRIPFKIWSWKSWVILLPPRKGLVSRYGRQKLVNWPEIVAYFKEVGSVSNRVNVEVLGKTTEGNSF
jgi:hypothetical protein